ncbi:hypothetical protein R3P38DRAFT_3191855 [Favolaschia claudopus]|uniref:Uncharacterized protein n=1 Tax=Favolaschia claudopus TaxID=2862362 RepID=A0AAW0BL93_9AGAR
MPAIAGNIPKSGLDAVETLLEEYESAENEEVSLYLRTSSIANKRVLDKSEIVDRGTTIPPQVLARFGLSAGYMLMVSRTIRQMQSLLKKMAALNPERRTIFAIDPQGVLLSVLASSKNIGELLAAWTALSKRMELAQGNLAKYHSEARSELESLLTPASTALEIYENLPRDVEPVKVVEYLYNHVPHLQTLRPVDYDPRSNSLEGIANVPQDLKAAFPPREPEARPVTIFYSTEGERREVAISPRSSHGLGPEFSLPHEQGVSSRRHPFQPEVDHPGPSKTPEWRSKAEGLKDQTTFFYLLARETPLGKLPYLDQVCPILCEEALAILIEFTPWDLYTRMNLGAWRLPRNQQRFTHREYPKGKPGLYLFARSGKAFVMDRSKRMDLISQKCRPQDAGRELDREEAAERGPFLFPPLPKEQVITVVEVLRMTVTTTMGEITQVGVVPLLPREIVREDQLLEEEGTLLLLPILKTVVPVLQADRNLPIQTTDFRT